MMTLHSMNHQQALDSMAVERYVLNEMTATDRQAFEEHYFNCPECLEAITYASDFLEVGREYVQEEVKTTRPRFQFQIQCGINEFFPVPGGPVQFLPLLLLHSSLCSGYPFIRESNSL